MDPGSPSMKNAPVESSDALTLAGDFEPATEEQWRAAVRGVLLRGRTDATDEEFADAFARRLVFHTEDGLDIEPLYDADDATPSGTPGFAPFVRSSHAAPVPWEIRQRVWCDVDGSSATTELEDGATGLLLEVGGSAGAAALERALEGVHLELAPISIATPGDVDGVTAAHLLADLWERRQVPSDDRCGTLGADPIGAWARSGGTTDLDAGLSAAASLTARIVDEAPSARSIVVDGTVWHDAGASAAQELAWNVAAAATHLRRLTDAGLDATAAARRLELRWSADADQFGTIAKLRAARRMWSRVAELAGLEPADRAAFQHVDCSRVMQTRYDTWVNALRTTVACFAAAIGGADAITTWPHDSLLRTGGSPLGRRVARNTQTILQLESNLARVVDPVGGSWYVEHLTDELARTAWTLLQDVESRGGIIDALADGTIEETLETVRDARATRVATRRRPLTGVSEFPDIDDPPPPTAEPSAEPASTPFPPLGLHRLSEGFEAQRARADRYEQHVGSRPAVFLATIGPQAASTARVTFAQNLFAAGGIRTTVGAVDDFDPQASAVACLCSSDDLYRAEADDAASRLRNVGAEHVYLAGRGLGIDGVDEEIGLGIDALDVLTRTLDRLGVDR